MEIKEELDTDFLRKEIAQDPRYRNVFSKIWKMKEECSSFATLQEIVNALRNFKQKQIDEMCKEWERACGGPMTHEEEQMFFGNSKVKASFALIDQLLDFIECTEKMDQITELFGFNFLAPTVIGKKIDGWWRGGEETAKVYKNAREAKKAEYQALFDEEMKKKPKWSTHALDKLVAKRVGKSVSHVHQTRTGYVRKKKI
jgi:hypothetical protein